MRVPQVEVSREREREREVGAKPRTRASVREIQIGREFQFQIGGRDLKREMLRGAEGKSGG